MTEASSERAMEPGKTSYRPVRVIGLLLILEVIGLVGLGAYEFLQIDWQQVRFEREPPRQVVEVLAFVLFAPPAVLTLLSALSFLLLRRRGWLLAAIAQGLSVAVSLWLYSMFQPVYVYPIMAYCVLMILYLNSQDVRVVFHLKRDAAKQGPGGVV
ncbi:MAG: hypothetical protein ICV58_03330 [Rubrobacteraceae bacterium]|nr:hypothetical protein [Rubrobacteraceae bacterium]